MTKERVKFIDMVRGLTILCIAVYHSIAPGLLRTFIAGICSVMFFSFFFYSGYLYVPGKAGIGKNISGRTKGLLMPFLLYSVSFWAVGSVVLVLKGEESITEALCCLRNFFAGSIWNRTIQDFFGWEYYSLGKRYPFLAGFWFLPAMFFSSLLFIILREKICKSVNSILISTAAMLLVTGGLRGLSVSLPYNLQLVPFWTAIMFMGSAGRGWRIFERLRGMSAWLAGSLVSVVCIGLSVYFGLGTNLFRGEFDKPEAGTMLFLFCLGNVSVWGISVLCRQIENTGINVDKMAYLGSHSIYIYMYHYFIAWAICMITGFSMRYDVDGITKDVLIGSFILAAVSIAGSILISVLFDRRHRESHCNTCESKL
ncbi:MAG: acyltransferase [Lachnospiraceae bacterium]|nr:acyltransferase [Lachnospiraceae bacterium]